MALYKDDRYLVKIDDDAFDFLHRPADTAPFSGIYRCEGCRKEVASNQGDPLPPQNHHQHDEALGDILRRLVVYADHDPQ
ncbi:MAG: hypothetical protein JJ959_11215 [Nisaea sp.]|uniref:hypothetical protein n=1 Tax=Nisaea sp. TaxID=2024842 RepID=UPI001B0E9CFC|nr:hypothetical protein [Nisaea sp.]MBO6561102.1 hypothetical protein [Nisaea sp.]